MAEAASGKTPPHSLEAEQSVLGALLQDNAVLADVAGVLQERDFYVPGHSLIYRAINELSAAGQPADVVTVHQHTQHDAQYLEALTYSVPSARGARAYAQIVHEQAMRRELMRIGKRLAEDAFTLPAKDAPVPVLVDQVVSALLAMVQAAGGTEPVDMPDLLGAFLDDLQARADGQQRTFLTGLADLDRLTAGGARRGELWVIGARPSMGKTALTLQLCRHVGIEHQVLMLTQEDSALSSTGRFVAAAGRVNLADLRNPMAAPSSMWTGVSDGVEELRPLYISMDDQTGLTLADVRRKAQQVKRRHGRLDMVVVDYLQLMDEGEGQNRSISLGYIANGLKRFAKEYQCWVVLLSQLNREADKRNGPPQMSDLRDSGDIEGAADLIGMLHREHMRKPTPENKHFALLHIAKQKNGPTGKVRLYFDGAFQRFGNWSGPAPRGAGDEGGDDGA